MIGLAELQLFFPRVNVPIVVGPYTCLIRLEESDEEDTFIVELKITQKDTKESHLIKFRLGLGKDRPTNSGVHDTTKPHFEIDIYRRAGAGESVKAYFTFASTTEQELLEYVKGTVVIITRILEVFQREHGVGDDFMRALVYAKKVYTELSAFEPKLLHALFLCYQRSELIIRESGTAVPMKTPRQVETYFGSTPELRPLFLPLLEKIKHEKKN